MPRGNLHRRIRPSFWCLCLAVTFSGALLGSFGISVARNAISSEEHAEASHLHSNGNGNVPWYYLTIYTIGIVVLSYYLGGAFSSVSHLENRDEGQPLATLLRLRTELKFLPISQFIRSQTKQNELRVVIPRNLEVCDEKETTSSSQSQSISCQTEVLIDAILQGYVFPWYNRISDEKTFPEHSKQILQFVFERLREKVQRVNRNALAKEAIQTMHYHWKEYCTVFDKKCPTEEDISNKYTFTHPYVNNREELSRHYESLLCLLLKSLVPPGLDYHVFCQFMAGILVKGVCMYYAELMSDPKWVNTTLVTMISSGNFANETSSNASGSNRSTAPPSPSPLTENRLEVEPERSEGALVSPSNPIKDKRALNLESEVALEGIMQFQQKQDALLEVVATKGSIHNFLRLDSGSGLDKKNVSKGSGMNSIQAALTGLLSATALPLLPDGSSYQRAIPDVPSKLPPETTIHASTPSDGPQPDYEDIERPKNWDTGLSAERSSSPTRHHSWEEGLKQKTCTNRGTGTQSLDENKGSHAVARQEEFDMSFDKPGESNQENCEKVNLVEASPMYDEAEDFAATIAKLRSLLEQRESRTNLMEEHQTDSVENAEVFQNESQTTRKNVTEPGGQTVKSTAMKIRPSLNSQSSASSLTSDGSSGSGSNFSHGSLDTERLDTIEDNGEDSDPVISRFFLNVVINKTESCGDAAGQFTLYCIQYEGVYIDGESDDSLPKLVLRTTTVKRSFKEFLLLQGQLEDSPIWRPHLRGIKTPSKWLNLSFPNQNSGNQRRILLERYLQQICSHSILGFCPEVRHFMAYGDDGFQIFGLPTSNNFPSQRFDKLTKTFTGVLNSLRDALPSFESDLQASQQQNAEIGGKVALTESKSKKLIPSIFQFGDKVTSPNGEAKLDAESVQVVKDSQGVNEDDRDEEMQCSSESGSGSDSASKDVHDQSMSAEAGSTELNSSTTEFAVDGKCVESYPLALAMTELLCDVLWLPHRRPHSASVSAFMSISGKSLENYLQETLDIFLSEEAFSGYLEWLTTCITEWTEAGPADGKQDKDEYWYTAEDLRRCFKQKIPVWVRWMWGRNQLDVTIERLVGFFQHSQINHDHILSLVELIFSKLNESTEVNVEEK